MPLTYGAWFNGSKEGLPSFYWFILEPPSKLSLIEALTGNLYGSNERHVERHGGNVCISPIQCWIEHACSSTHQPCCDFDVFSQLL
jgi:hypothetical protein